MTKEKTVEFVTGFLEQNHNGLSKDWLKRPGWCRTNIKEKVSLWWEKAYAPARNDKAELSEADVQYIESQKLRKWEKLFLHDALKFILNHKNDNGTVFISSRKLQSFKGANTRNYKARRNLLFQLGVLKLKERPAKRLRQADVYWVLYRFNGSRGSPPSGPGPFMFSCYLCMHFLWSWLNKIGALIEDY
jgi:hypothetical protein